MRREAWPLTRLRYEVDLNPSENKASRFSDGTEVSFVAMESLHEDGTMTLDITRPVEEVRASYSSFEDGDVLFAKVTPCFENGKAALAAGLSHGVGFGTTEVTVLRTRNRIDASYLYHMTIEDSFRQGGIASMTGAGGLKRVSDRYVRDYSLALPPMDEQRQIAEYLDRETGQIDALIAKQEQLVETLIERRQAVIAQAVTRGLDPDVELKDSRDEWIGSVPEHWVVRKLSQAFMTIGSGTTPPAEGTDHYGGDIPWVTTGELRESVIHVTAKTVTSDAVRSLSALKVFPAGSLVIAMYGATIGRLGILGVDATTNQACCVMAHPRGVVVAFVYFSLHAAKKRILLMATGGGQPNINQDVVRQLRVALPPLAEQKAIAVYLADATSEMDALIRKAREMIALLRERRQALISAAVTGKIDVRGL